MRQLLMTLSGDMVRPRQVNPQGLRTKHRRRSNFGLVYHGTEAYKDASWTSSSSRFITQPHNNSSRPPLSYKQIPNFFYTLRSKHHFDTMKTAATTLLLSLASFASFTVNNSSSH